MSNAVVAWEERMVKLLDAIAHEKRPCKRCGRLLWMVKHANGRTAPYTSEGVNHFADCPHAAEFRSPKAAGGGR